LSGNFKKIYCPGERKKMINKKDALIISHLRKNARESMVNLAQNTGIPVSTVYDRTRVNEKYFKKHVSLLNFSLIGLPSQTIFTIKVGKEYRNLLQEHLMRSANINSLYKMEYGCDFCGEGIFKNAAQVEVFFEKLERDFRILELKRFQIVTELKKEDLLTKPEHFEMLNDN
jgi:DNA-binding Lrp family transcriptional regulator